MSEHESKVSPNKDSEAPAAESINMGRRRLSKAALAAPVVVASLSARPAMACSVSGFISGNTSPGRTPPTCEGYGCTPGFWKNNPEVWFRTGTYSAGSCNRANPSGNCQEWEIGGTKLSDILTCPNPFIGINSGDFLLDILLKGVGNGNNYTNGYADVCHYIAAILNAASTPAYGSSVAEIQDGLCRAAEMMPSKVNYYTTDLLAKLNERGCIYDAHGDCKQGFVLNNAPLRQCIPACPTGYTFDADAVKCVPEAP